MNYIILNNQNSILSKFEEGFLNSSLSNEVKKLAGFDYILKCTNCILSVEEKLEHTDVLLKCIDGIDFVYKGKKFHLKKSSVLDLCYIDYLGISENNFIKLKMLEEAVEAVEEVEAVEAVGKKKKINK